MTGHEGAGDRPCPQHTLKHSTPNVSDIQVKYWFNGLKSMSDWIVIACNCSYLMKKSDLTISRINLGGFQYHWRYR